MRDVTAGFRPLPILVFEVALDRRDDLALGHLAGQEGQPVNKRPTRVQYVPGRPLLTLPARSGCMDAEPFDDLIPKRLVLFDQEALREGHPKLVDHEVATPEIRKL